MQAEESQAVWVLVKGFFSISPADFEARYTELLQDIRDNKIDHKGKLLYAYGILLRASKHKVIEFSTGEITNLIEDYYKRNLQENRNASFKKQGLQGVYNNRSGRDGFTNKPFQRTGSYGGHAFNESYSEEMQAMLDKMFTEQKERETEQLKNEFLHVIRALRANFEDICKETRQGLYSGENFWGKYSQHPVFAYITAKDEFYESVLSLPGELIYEFMDLLLVGRYRLQYKENNEVVYDVSATIPETFFPEKAFIADFVQYIKKRNKKHGPLYNPIVIVHNFWLSTLEKVKNYVALTRIISIGIFASNIHESQLS